MTYLERAELAVKDPSNFEKVLPEVVPLLRGAAGCHGVRVLRGVEEPTAYLLLLEWESVSAHVDFTKTEAFRNFVGLVREHFSGPSTMHHFEEVARLP
jgi:heme-degrading monooxygenase HmoA